MKERLIIVEPVYRLDKETPWILPGEYRIMRLFEKERYLIKVNGRLTIVKKGDYNVFL